MPVHTFTATEESLLQNVGKVIRTVEPEARIFLYGSRARGDALPDSDWDLLVLVDGQSTPARTTTIRHLLYALERQTDSVLSAVVRGKDEWDELRFKVLPFHSNVERDRVEL